MTTDVMTSGPWPEPAIVDTDAIALAIVRHEGMRIEGLPAAFDSSYGPVMVALQGAGLHPVGAALAVYEGDPMAEFAVEIGFPVNAPLPEAVESIVQAQLRRGDVGDPSAVGAHLRATADRFGVDEVMLHPVASERPGGDPRRAP